MGGGTFSYDVPAKTADESEQVFRTAMNESEEVTEEPRLRNVFISFAVEDEVRVNLLRSQAKDDNFDVEFRDYSVKEPFDEKWKPEVSDLISMTSAVIVMIGVETAKSRAVDWEIREGSSSGQKSYWSQDIPGSKSPSSTCN